MRSFFCFALILALSASSLNAQARKNKAARQQENIDYPSLVEKSIKAYDVEAADLALEKWQKALNASGKSTPAAYKNLQSQVLNLRNLLERVEKIELIDTLLVDEADFFDKYMLSDDAGYLFPGTELPEDIDVSYVPKMINESQNGKVVLWAEPVDSARSRIVESRMLDDGSMTAPASFGDAVNSMGMVNYPYLLDDGMTIYFAAKGDESIGGYDIFMTRRSPDGEMMQPQNLGMPYNSPYNDYMMVIDETRNLGWWASDRSGIPGKVTIYVFRPSQMRVNYDPDSPSLVDYALLRHQKPAGNLESYLNDKVSPVEIDDESGFVMSMGDGKVYTSMSQFRKAGARQVMEDLLVKQGEEAALKQELEQLRLAYGKGDKSKASRILELERQLSDISPVIKRLSNKVVSAEKSK